jgi:hypothetical protein
VIVVGGHGVDVYSCHMALVSWGAHDFVAVACCELCRVYFAGGEAEAEVGGGAVEGCAGEATHRGDGGAEHPADLALESVEFGVAEEPEAKGEVLADEESSDDSDSAELYH